MTDTKTKTTRDPRTFAEWVSFGIACFVLLVVVGLILAQTSDAQAPAEPVASQSGAVREANGRFFVPVEVVNSGEVTASEVQVSAELTIEGETTQGEQTIGFLASDEIEDLTFVFDDDPRTGELVVSVGSFATP